MLPTLKSFDLLFFNESRLAFLESGLGLGSWENRQKLGGFFMYQIGYKIIDKKCQFPILAIAGIEVKAVEQLWESNIFYPYTCTFSYSFQIQRLISSSKSPECLAYFWAGEENLLKSLMLYCITLQLIHLQPNQSELWNQVGLVSKVNERKPLHLEEERICKSSLQQCKCKRNHES